MPHFNRRPTRQRRYWRLAPLLILAPVLGAYGVFAIATPTRLLPQHGATAYHEHGATVYHAAQRQAPSQTARSRGAVERRNSRGGTLGALAGTWTSVRPVAAPASSPFSAPSSQTAILLLRQHGEVLRGILTAFGGRYEVAGRYDPPTDAVVLQWGEAPSITMYTGRLDRRNHRLVGAWQASANAGNIVFARTSVDAHVDLPPDGTPIPSPTPTLIPYVPPVATASAIPTTSSAQAISGVWRIDGGLYMLGAGADAFVTLHQQGGTLSGVLTQGEGRYQVTGTYDPAFRNLSLSLPLANGGTVVIQGTLAPNGRQGLGAAQSGGVTSEIGMHRISAHSIVAAHVNGSSAAPTATLVVPPTPTNTPTPVPTDTPIPAGDINATWTWFGTGPTSFMNTPTTMTLHRSGGTLTGLLSSGAGRYQVAGTYGGGQIVVEWSIPGQGHYRWEGGVGGDMKSMMGVWYGPEGDGGSGFTRSATTTGPAAPQAQPTATPVSCLPNGAGLNATWEVQGGIPSLGFGPATLTIQQRGARLTGVVHGATERYDVTGSYDHASGQVTLSWGAGTDAVHFTGTASSGLDHILGSFGDGRGDSGGLMLGRQLC